MSIYKTTEGHSNMGEPWDSLLSEISQQKKKYHILRPIPGTYNAQNHRENKSNSGCQGLR